MPRKYKPVSGSPRLRYSQKSLEAAMHSISSNAMTIRQAAHTYNIPYTTLQNRASGRPIEFGKIGRKPALLPHEELIIAQNVASLADFGYAFDTESSCEFVQSYVLKVGRAVPQFVVGKPGKDWAYNFLNRHINLLTQRVCQNISRKRASVSEEDVTRFFSNIEKVTDGVPSENIINFDETNFSDDPKGKTMIFRRGTKHPERIINSSKTSISVMYACSAAGAVLPPYVVYKAEHLMNTWVLGGPIGTRYNRTKSGWFDRVCFDDWFEKIVIPYIKTLPKEEKNLLIGDNLASHFSADVLELCEQYNISYVFLPPNSTGLLQPLDVGVYGPMKHAWRKTLTAWKNSQQGAHFTTLPKQHFPSLLYKLMELMDNNISELAISGFKGCGIVPLNPSHILAKVKKELPDTDTSRQHVSELVLEKLQVLRESSTASPTTGRKRGKRVNVEPGMSVTSADLDDKIQTPSTSKRARVNTGEEQRRKRKNSSSSESDASSTNSMGKSTSECKATTTGVAEKIINEGDYVVVKFCSTGTKRSCQLPVHFVGKVLQEQENMHWDIKYFRKLTVACPKTNKVIFTDRNVPDIHCTPASDIVMSLDKPDISKGRLYFENVFGNLLMR